MKFSLVFLIAIQHGKMADRNRYSYICTECSQLLLQYTLLVIKSDKMVAVPRMNREKRGSTGVSTMKIPAPRS